MSVRGNNLICDSCAETLCTDRQVSLWLEDAKWATALLIHVCERCREDWTGARILTTLSNVSKMLHASGIRM